MDTLEKISVVIPCYYSEASIAKVVDLTRQEIKKAGYDYEFILVNDGSTDGTFAVITELAEADSRVIGINLAKNFGQHSAIMAGLRQVSGEYVMLMDDDMQTHPSQCKILFDAIDDESDVIFAEWVEHKEAWWRELGSRFTTWSTRVLTNRPKDIYSSNFLIMKRYVCDEVCKYEGPYVYIQGLIFRSTSHIKNVMVEHFDRETGQSGYNLKSLIQLWSRVLNFSMMPLRAASVIGSILGVAGIIGAIILLIQKLVVPTMQIGWSSLMVSILICSGAIILFLGIIGEYIGRLFMTSNKTPQYVLRDVINDNDTGKR